VQACSACRAIVADLKAVAARASSLPDAPPSANLWPGIAKRLGAATVVPFQARAPRRISFTIPQLVAASLALMVLSGAMVWLSKVGGARTDVGPVAAVDRMDQSDRVEPADLVPANLVPANFADAHYEQAVADLQKALEAGRDQLDPQTVRVLEENLMAIDRAIEQSRRALTADPANIFLNIHLAAARNRKLALLRNATALASNSS